MPKFNVRVVHTVTFMGECLVDAENKIQAEFKAENLLETGCLFDKNGLPLAEWLYKENTECDATELSENEDANPKQTPPRLPPDRLR